MHRFDASFGKSRQSGQININMSMKLYVGNLPFSTSNQDLNDIFGEIGAVESCNVIEDRETGRSRGFGFVEMASEDAATAAISQFNGQEYDGRSMVVNEARPREDRPRGGGNRSYAGSDGGNYGGGRSDYGGDDRW